MGQKKNGGVTDNDLRLQPDEPSLLFAIQELIRTGGVDFDKWFDEFKTGFYPRSGIATNFKQEEWKKPKFIDITPNNSQSGCRTIEYWRDRDIQEKSVILSGTESDLIRHIVHLEYEGGGLGSNETYSGKNSKPPLAGFPAINLIFRQPHEDMKAIEKFPAKGTKLIRCVGYTDSYDLAAKESSLKIVDHSAVKGWAKKIQNIFAPSQDNLFLWKKGQYSLSYSGMVARLQGLEGYAYVRNEQDGIALFAAMLKVFDKKPDPLGFNFSGSTSARVKYAPKNKETIILNKKNKLPDKRPVVDVRFERAVLILPSGQETTLVYRNTVLYK